MKLVPLALIGVFGLASIAPALAQKPASPPPVYVAPMGADGVPAAKAATIRHLLTLMGTVKLSQQMMDQMFSSMQGTMPQVPAEFWTKVHASMNASDLIDLLIPIYSKHYSQADLDGLVAFYQTPLGQKVVAELPQISQESMAVGQQWGQQKAQQIVTQMQQEQTSNAAKSSRQ